VLGPNANSDIDLDALAPFKLNYLTVECPDCAGTGRRMIQLLAMARRFKGKRTWRETFFSTAATLIAVLFLTAALGRQAMTLVKYVAIQAQAEIRQGGARARAWWSKVETTVAEHEQSNGRR
jgi:hypothetical protein